MLPVHNHSNHFTLKDGEAGTLQPALRAWIPGHQNPHWPHKVLPALPCTVSAQSCKRRAENRRMCSEQSWAHGLNPPQRANWTNQGRTCRWWVLQEAKLLLIQVVPVTPELLPLQSHCFSHKILCKKLRGAPCVRSQSHGGDDGDLITCRAACTVSLYNR